MHTHTQSLTHTNTHAPLTYVGHNFRVKKNIFSTVLIRSVVPSLSLNFIFAITYTVNSFTTEKTAHEKKNKNNQKFGVHHQKMEKRRHLETKLSFVFRACVTFDRTNYFLLIHPKCHQNYNFFFCIVTQATSM